MAFWKFILSPPPTFALSFEAKALFQEHAGEAMNKPVLLIYLLLLFLTNISRGQDIGQINILRKQIEDLQPAACGTNVATVDPDSASFLASQSKKLLALIDQRIAALKARTDLDDSEKSGIEQQYRAQQEVLKAGCGNLTPLPISNEAQSCSGTSPLKALPTSLDFGAEEVSTPTEKTLQLSNGTGTTSTITDFRISINNGKAKRCGTDAYGNSRSLDFNLVTSDTPCLSSLDASANCTLKVQFSPCLAGDVSPDAAIEISGKTGNPSACFQTSIALLGSGQVLNLAHIENTAGQTSTPITRAVAGIDISGASSAATQQKLFVEFDLNAPLGWGTKDPLEKRVWLFVNPRITSVPQSSSAISGLDVQGDFLSTALQQQKTTDLVSGLDLLAGTELFLLKPRSGVPFWSEYKNAHAKLAIALVGAVGFTTPFTTPTSGAEEIDLKTTPAANIAANFPDLPASLLANMPKKTILALVQKDRSRFYRKYYGGFRLKTYFFSSEAKGDCDKLGDDCEALLNQFPGIIDITAGQDESVTGGRLANWVFRLDAVYPLPFVPALHVFGSVLSSFEKNRYSLPLFAPTTTAPLTDPTVLIHAIGPPDRDSYRIGIGVDLVQLLKKKVSVSPKQSTPTPAAAPAPATTSTPAGTNK